MKGANAGEVVGLAAGEASAAAGGYSWHCWKELAFGAAATQEAGELLWCESSLENHFDVGNDVGAVVQSSSWWSSGEATTFT